jgi:hypothetical protein
MSKQTMTPKEKAKHLFDKMSNQTYRYQEYAGANYTTCEIGYEAGVKCALIAVDEIINSRPAITASQIVYKNYWQEVKQEIEKL